MTIDLYPEWLTKEIDQYDLPKEMIFDFYPEFDEVFVDDTLLGLFYPLCTVSSIPAYPNTKLHFVSSNGVWLDEQYNNIENNDQYICFKLVDNRYAFQGDRRLYRGHDIAKELYTQLDAYFKQYTDIIMANRLNADEYIDFMKKEVLTVETPEGFDLNYYIQTFYEFSINRRLFRTTGKYNQYRSYIYPENFIHDGKILKREEFDPIDATLDSDSIYTQYVDILNGCTPIGSAVGFIFFSDGNNSELFFNQDQQYALSVNFYS